MISVINWHFHWNKFDIHDNIPYFTVQSLIENENDLWIPSEAYTIVELNEEWIELNIKWNYPQNFSCGF